MFSIVKSSKPVAVNLKGGYIKRGVDTYGNMRLFSADSTPTTWQCGDTANGVFRYKLVTTHGIFIVYHNNSFAVSDYVRPDKADPSNELCSNIDHFRQELHTCGIAVQEIIYQL